MQRRVKLVHRTRNVPDHAAWGVGAGVGAERDAAGDKEQGQMHVCSASARENPIQTHR